MKLPDKLDRIAKMEIKAPSFGRSKRDHGAAESARAAADHSSAEDGAGRLAALKRPVSLKRPSLGRRKQRAAGGAAAGAAAGGVAAAASKRRPSKESPKLPGPVNDLYRDLRDRHLLIPIAALLVALVAVPLLLAREPAPPPVTPPADLSAGESIAPAVVVENVGVRDYRKRLDALKRTNPFESPSVNLAAATDAGAGTDSITDPTSSATTDTGSDVPTDTGSGLPTDTGSGLPTDTGVPPSDPVDDGSTDESSDEEPEPADPIIRYIDQVVTHEVDASAGSPLNGALKSFTDLKSLQPVPSKTNQVAAYMGVDEDGTAAAFLLSTYSVLTKNKGGDCYPSPEQCQVVFLEQGEEIRVDFQKENQQEATPYRVKVNRIAEKRTRVRD